MPKKKLDIWARIEAVEAMLANDRSEKCDCESPLVGWKDGRDVCANCLRPVSSIIAQSARFPPASIPDPPDGIWPNAADPLDELLESVNDGRP